MTAGVSENDRTPEGVLLGKMELDEAKRLRSLLEPKGIGLVLFSNPSTCASGSCGCQVEVYVAEAEVPAVVSLLETERARELAGLDVNPALLSQVYDDAQDTAQCPACGTIFSTTLAECPDCGLGFRSE